MPEEQQKPKPAIPATDQPKIESTKAKSIRLAKNKKVGEALSKMTDERLLKLDEAFAMDYSVVEACHHAEIAESTYYRWLNVNPKLSERFALSQSNLVRKSKLNIHKGIEKDQDIPLSERYLARKNPEEHADPVRIIDNGDKVETSDEEEQIRSEYRKKMIALRHKKSQARAKEEGEIQ